MSGGTPGHVRGHETFTATDLEAILQGDNSTLLIADATIHTFDPVIGSLPHAEVLIRNGRIAGVGPGIINAAHDPRPGSPAGAVLVAAAGSTVVPLVRDLSVLALGRREGLTPRGALVPGAEADFLVIAGVAPADPDAVAELLRRDPACVLAVFRDGLPIHWRGEEVGRGGPEAESPDVVGEWVDAQGFLVQTLTADGRYHETRGGRDLAFQGRYWVRGSRIDYHDDLGLWAYGEIHGDVLHHAGYRMRRRAM